MASVPHAGAELDGLIAVIEVDDQLVHVGTRNGRVFCTSRDELVRWRKSLQGAMAHLDGATGYLEAAPVV